MNNSFITARVHHIITPATLQDMTVTIVIVVKPSEAKWSLSNVFIIIPKFFLPLHAWRYNYTNGFYINVYYYLIYFTQYYQYISTPEWKLL